MPPELMNTHLQEFVELLNAEQHVHVDKLREYAKQGVATRVRGEVWMYLLDVLSPDRTSEITTLISMNTAYQALPTQIPSSLTSLLHKTALSHHTHRFFNPTYAGLITSITAEAEVQPPRSRDNTVSSNARESTRSNTTGPGANASTGHPSTVTGGTRDSSGGATGGGGFLAAPPVPTSGVVRATAPVTGARDPGMPIPAPPLRSSATSSSSNRSSPSVPANASIPPPQLNLDEQTQKSNHSTNSSGSISGNNSNGNSNSNNNGGGTNNNNLTIRSQYMRFLPPPPTTTPSRHSYLSLLDEVLRKFYNLEKAAGRDGQLRQEESGGLLGVEANWVYLATPFICCFARPVAVFLAFQKLMDRMRTFPPFPSRLASLLTLFRLAQPELFSYFEDEQVPYVQVASSWLTTMLSKEMWLGNVLRLWDAYLAADDMFSLHCYVCVAVLGTCKETLEELDGSEAKLLLLDLPPMDVDRLLQDAANLRVTYPLPGPVDGGLR